MIILCANIMLCKSSSIHYVQPKSEVKECIFGKTEGSEGIHSIDEIMPQICGISVF